MPRDLSTIDLETTLPWEPNCRTHSYDKDTGVLTAEINDGTGKYKTCWLNINNCLCVNDEGKLVFFQGPKTSGFNSWPPIDMQADDRSQSVVYDPQTYLMTCNTYWVKTNHTEVTTFDLSRHLGNAHGIPYFTQPDDEPDGATKFVKWVVEHIPPPSAGTGQPIFGLAVIRSQEKDAMRQRDDNHDRWLANTVADRGWRWVFGYDNDSELYLSLRGGRDDYVGYEDVNPTDYEFN